MKRIYIIALGIGVSLAACTSKKATTSTASPADVVKEMQTKYTEAQREEGKTLWQGNCQKCHKLYQPETRTVGKWENVLPRMNKRAKLTDEQAALVRAYLIANAKV
ncbi:hypothetical protein CAP35_09700 [Chitinophagaceae bacterium IBVUCB1]|jgi:cytochrome c5|nr:hypothetical protein CAP35_09700 [Chitinophagaceae bacterium IBVUCB1]